MYLLDTNVLSHLSPAETRPQQQFRDWARQNGDRCYLSAVSLMEIAYGIAWLRHRRATARAARLHRWWEELLAHHADRVLPVGHQALILAGDLMAKARSAGTTPDIADAWIAATASIHALEVLTVNLADFRPFGIACRDPLTDPLPP